jgi:hypothetical protein
MTEIERLVAIEEIKRLVARRIRCMDTKNWDEYPSTHTPDAVLDSFGNLPGDLRPSSPAGAGVAMGRAAVTAAVRKVVDPLTTVHHAHTPEIEILSPSTARGVWAMEDLLSWQNGDRFEQLRGFGHYHETYEKLDGAWMIKSRKLTRLRVDTTPGFFDYRQRAERAD